MMMPRAASFFSQAEGAAVIEGRRIAAGTHLHAESSEPTSAPNLKSGSTAAPLEASAGLIGRRGVPPSIECFAGQLIGRP